MKFDTRIIAASVALGAAAPIAAGQSTDTQPPQQQGQGTGQWSPESVSVVGYDIDRDGRTDGWYYVTKYEYEKLCQDCERAQGRPVYGQIVGQPREMYTMRPPQPGGQGHAMAQPEQFRLSGEVKDLATFTFAPDGQEHIVGKVLAEGGQELPVHFGLAGEVSDKVREGDTVTVLGRTGTLNGRKIILADHVRAGETEFSVGPMGQSLARISGMIERTDMVQLRDGTESVLARISTTDGRTEIVALGSREQLQLNMPDGREISVLGEPARIDGRPLILASMIYVDGRAKEVAAAPEELHASSDFLQSYSELEGTREAAAESAGGDAPDDNRD